MKKKTMTRRLFPLVVAVVLAVALAIPGVAVAAEATATRTLPASSVDAGADFDVSIEASGCGSMGQVVETLPDGFSYVGTDSTDVLVTQDGDTVSFTFMGGSVTFDYTVTASTTEGTHIFSGIVKDEDLIETAIGGDTDITVGPAEGATATRTLPASSVDEGADFDVSIEASGCGSMGQVVETLPDGFSYVGTDSTDVGVTQDGDDVSFTFIGDSVTFDYQVTASTTEGTHVFSGIVKDEDLVETAISGDTDITVSPDGGPITFTIPLPSGWNLLSTPFILNTDNDTLEQILGESEANIEASWRWDTQSQQWEVPTDYDLSPLEAVYLKVASDASATAEFIPSQEPWGPPSRVLQEGLNLIGSAPALEPGGFPDLPLDHALVTIEQVSGGLRGYTIVVSPLLNQPGWTYAVGVGAEVEDLLAFKGYWIVMENGPDTLYGFSTTPLP